MTDMHICFVSQVSISFENYRKVHPYDSDSSEDEVDWQDTPHDPYRAGMWQFETVQFLRLIDLRI